MMTAPPTGETRNQEATCYIGNLDERVTESLLWELMLQAGMLLGKGVCVSVVM